MGDFGTVSVVYGLRDCEIIVTTEILLRIDELGADPQRIHELTGALQNDLLTRGVQDAQPVYRDDTAVGARGFQWESLGMLLVSIQGSAQALLQLVTVVRTWLKRGGSPRTVELTIGESTLRLSDASEDQQERLIDEFVRVNS